MKQRIDRAIAFQAPGETAEDGWDVIFPDLPGCVSQGASMAEARLPVELPGKSVRLNITRDTALVDRLAAAAARDGLSRSGFPAQAVREKLQREREAV